MINYIKGVLTAKSPVLAVVEAAGIGWELKIPVSTYEKLPRLGENCQLNTFLHFTQDGPRLYGFASVAENELFQLLISVSGVGPRTAISIISTLSISTFIRAIQLGEEVILIKVPGLGKKSVQRLIVELKDSIHRVGEYLEPGEMIQMDKNALEVESALLSLGFNAKDIQRVVSMITAEDKKLTIEELIKET
ncbi:MAG TPA: Holliday junction branch migration protein RuvA, partial [Candidatus Cloacimonadota bacterium]|nr:Holliday junction branch migration protein RuvA [Candidatus Cloacimonadota bacterium]